MAQVRAHHNDIISRTCTWRQGRERKHHRNTASLYMTCTKLSRYTDQLPLSAQLALLCVARARRQLSLRGRRRLSASGQRPSPPAARARGMLLCCRGVTKEANFRIVSSARNWLAPSLDRRIKGGEGHTKTSTLRSSNVGERRRTQGRGRAAAAGWWWSAAGAAPGGLGRAATRQRGRAAATLLLAACEAARAQSGRAAARQSGSEAARYR